MDLNYSLLPLPHPYHSYHPLLNCLLLSQQDNLLPNLHSLHQSLFVSLTLNCLSFHIATVSLPTPVVVAPPPLRAYTRPNRVPRISSYWWHRMGLALTWCHTPHTKTNKMSKTRRWKSRPAATAMLRWPTSAHRLGCSLWSSTKSFLHHISTRASSNLTTPVTSSSPSSGTFNHQG